MSGVSRSRGISAELLEDLIARHPLDAVDGVDDIRKTMCQARDTFCLLDAKTSLTQVAARVDNIQAFGIGHLIFNLFRKKLIISAASPERILQEVYALLKNEPEERKPSRYFVLSLIRTLGHISPDVNDRALKPAGTNPCLRALGMLISEAYKIPFEQITSASRVRTVVEARFVAIYVMRHVCGHSLTLIGQNMGNRDHTTILNSINKISLMMAEDAAFRTQMEKLCERADTIGIMQNRTVLARQA